MERGHQELQDGLFFKMYLWMHVSKNLACTDWLVKLSACTKKNWKIFHLYALSLLFPKYWTLLVHNVEVSRYSLCTLGFGFCACVHAHDYFENRASIICYRKPLQSVHLWFWHMGFYACTNIMEIGHLPAFSVLFPRKILF